MNEYVIVILVLVLTELVYFLIAARCGIVDKPNGRSSHSRVVLRGGGVIFLVGIWIWEVSSGIQHPWFLIGLTLVAGVSFWDDIRSLPDSVRLAAQSAAAGAVLQQHDVLMLNMWLSLVGIVVFVGIMNVYNFMDGINGITGGYSVTVLLSLIALNLRMEDGFVDSGLLMVALLSVLVFCIFNFRSKGREICFAGDVGSISMACILLFAMSALILSTGDVTYLLLMAVYGVDACLTICHRILLHEDLGTAHRKHAYQIMANELGMGHMKVTGLYMIIQLAVSAVFIYLVPDTVPAHWIYLFGVVIVLSVSYLLFMKKYYHLHEEYLLMAEKDK